MILEALYRYYDIMYEKYPDQIPKVGFKNKPVSLALEIDDDGNAVNLKNLNLVSSKGKEYPCRMFLPMFRQRASDVTPYFLHDNSQYLLGYDPEDTKGTAEMKQQAFAKFHYNMLKDIPDPGAKAFLLFLSKWNSEKLEEKVFKENEEKLAAASNIVIEYKNTYLHERPMLEEKWLEYYNHVDLSEIGQCSITGERVLLERLHPVVKGVKGEMATGSSLVSFNDPSYDSYGKQQGYNAPIGRVASFKFTTALEYLLGKKENKLTFGDMTLVFWAESDNTDYDAAAAYLLNPEYTYKTQDTDADEGEADEPADSPEDIPAQDTLTPDAGLKSIINNMLQGLPAEDIYKNLDPTTTFYILGLVPNMKRLSIKFYFKDTFGAFAEKVLQHYRDIEICRPSMVRGNIPVWKILSELQPASKRGTDSKGKIPPRMEEGIIEAIMTGSMYPISLLPLLVTRVRSEGNQNQFVQFSHVRMSMIKGFINRYNRLYKNKEVELSMALDKNNENTGYLLGRLFALLERAQENAHYVKGIDQNGKTVNKGEVNKSIKDRYFAAACTTPLQVYPYLIKLNQHHIEKTAYNIPIDREIENILCKSKGFPAFLSQEDQGQFIIAYYQQRQHIFDQLRNDKKEKEESA